MAGRRVWLRSGSSTRGEFGDNSILFFFTVGHRPATGTTRLVVPRELGAAARTGPSRSLVGQPAVTAACPIHRSVGGVPGYVD
jgi:hypothetical protein